MKFSSIPFRYIDFVYGIQGYKFFFQKTSQEYVRLSIDIYSEDFILYSIEYK